MEEFVKFQHKGWTFSVGQMTGKKERPYIARVESPEGEVSTRAFANDNEARIALAGARTNVSKGDEPWHSQ